MEISEIIHCYKSHNYLQVKNNNSDSEMELTWRILYEIGMYTLISLDLLDAGPLPWLVLARRSLLSVDTKYN